MTAGRRNPFAKQPPRRVFPRFGFANHPCRTCPSPNDRRTHRPLQVHANVIPRFSQLPSKPSQLPPRSRTQRPPRPSLGVHQVDAVHQRHPIASNLSPGFRPQQPLPSGLNRPSQKPLGMRQTKCRHGRQGMQNIAHCPQPDNQNTQLSCSGQYSIFSRQSCQITLLSACRESALPPNPHLAKRPPTEQSATGQLPPASRVARHSV
jgi:hypothetical protein